MKSNIRSSAGFAAAFAVAAFASLGCDEQPVPQDIATRQGAQFQFEPFPEDPCATVLCAAGTHCEPEYVECYVAPCPPAVNCVPDAPGPFCGGIAGIPCPGGAECVDDPSDDCDPNAGGADCGGICQCPLNAACPTDTWLDASPGVCACIPTTPVCGAICQVFCEFGNIIDANGCPTCACNPPPRAVDKG